MSELPAGVQMVDAASPVGFGASFVLAIQADGSWIVSDGGHQISLPDGFTPTGIVGGPEVVWVEGSRAGVPTLLVIDPNHSLLEIAHTVRLANTADLSVTFTSPHTAFVASAGSIYRVKLPA